MREVTLVSLIEKTRIDWRHALGATRKVPIDVKTLTSPIDVLALREELGWKMHHEEVDHPDTGFLPQRAP